MDFLDYARATLKEIETRIAVYQKILRQMPEEHGRLIQNGREYHIVEDGRRRYANQEDRIRVERMKQRRFLTEAIRRMEKNKKNLMRLLREYQSCTYDDINQWLPRSYRGAYIPASAASWREGIPPFTQSENTLYPEELIHTTSFGLITRTKGEMEIAELLYKLGIPFRYEMRLVLYDHDGNRSVIYPDFSIPVDGEWFFIEHLGLMTKEGYRKRNVKKLYDYHHNGILMPGQLIFTMDGPDGGLDVGPVIEFMTKMILPRIQMESVQAGC